MIKPLTAEHACWYIHRWFRNEKGEPIQIFDWWREILGALFDPRYRLILVNTIRQQGKTQLCLDYLLYRLLVDRDFYAIAITNAEEQMRRFVNQKIGRPLKHMNETIRLEVDVKASLGEIRVARRNNLLKILPANRATSTGTSPDTIFFDEARDAPDTLWEEIAPSVMSRPDAKLLVASTAGAPSGFFYDLVTAQEEEPREDWYLFRSKAEINPRTNRAKLRKILSVGSRAGELRNLDNEFAAEGDELLSRDAIDRAISKDLKQKEASDKPCWGFLDISIKRDLTSLVLVERPDPESPALEVVRLTYWEPARMPGGRIDFGLVRMELSAVLAKFDVQRLLVDTASGGGELINWAIRSGQCPPIEEFHPTASSNQAMWGRLRDVLLERLLRIPDDKRLVDELRGLKTQQYSHGLGFKVLDPSKRLHRDLSFSLAGAVWIASEAWAMGETKISSLSDVWDDWMMAGEASA